jgi:ABC-type arginine/histidine transport system permease subunit
MGTMIPDLLPAIWVTVRLSVLSLSLGLVLAALVAYVQVRRVPVLSQAAFAYALYFIDPRDGDRLSSSRRGGRARPVPG